MDAGFMKRSKINIHKTFFTILKLPQHLLVVERELISAGNRHRGAMVAGRLVNRRAREHVRMLFRHFGADRIISQCYQ